MNKTAESVVHFSEDYHAGITGAGDDGDIDLVQYETKNYNFWKSSDYKRGAKRKIDYHGQYTYSLEGGDRGVVIDDNLNTDLQEKVIHFPAVFTSRIIGDRAVNTLQEWECVVECIEDGVVEARGVSIYEENPEDEVLYIPETEFSNSDREVLSSGVIFRLVIFYSKAHSGQLTRQSTCYIRTKFSTARDDHECHFDIFGSDD